MGRDSEEQRVQGKTCLSSRTLIAVSLSDLRAAGIGLVSQRPGYPPPDWSSVYHDCAATQTSEDAPEEPLAAAWRFAASWFPPDRALPAATPRGKFEFELSMLGSSTSCCRDRRHPL